MRKFEVIYERHLKRFWFLMPVFFVSYVVLVNLAPFGYVEFLIDVGGNDAVGSARLTGPFDRVSGPLVTEGLTYRNLNNPLVYFDLEYPLPFGASEIEVSMKFKDTLLGNERFSVGARSKDGSWYYRLVYGKFLENKTIYRELPSDIPCGSLVATNLDLGFRESVLDDVSGETLVVNSFLQGSHTSYVYVKDRLDLTVQKCDLNMYNGEDVLNISIFKGETLIHSLTIPDDGIVDRSKRLGMSQDASISIPSLQEGVYKIVFDCGDDLFVKRIEIFPAKFVLDRSVFSIGTNSSLLFGDASETRLYFSAAGKRLLRFSTPNKNAFQNVTVSNETIYINATDNWFKKEVESGFYELIMPKSNVKVDGNVFFSFTEESYFDPFEFRTISMAPNNVAIADYVVSDVEFERDGEWIIAKARWNIEDLLLKDEQLSFVINTSFLKGDRTLSVDWIRIRIIKK